MATSEDIFAREFRETLRRLAAQPGGRLHVSELHNPLTELSIPVGRPFEVDGIEDSLFSKLNGAEVYALGKVKPERYVYERTGKRKVDLHGNEVTEVPTTPKGSLWVRTDRKIDIPYRFKDGDKGFNYANAWRNAPGPHKYVYAVPKENLYSITLSALAVSVRTMKCFSGYTFKSWHFGNLNLAVIPYNPNAKYTDTVILGTKKGIDYDQEINKFVGFQVEAGIIPRIPNYYVNGTENLVYKEMVPSYSDYVPRSEKPLSEEGSLTYSDPLFSNTDSDSVDYVE